ncbi:Aminopeptidase YwaD precursor [Clostridium liquoris]|jgi:hypothetical protein|uniref:Aminopeptidase YwaD n=1 Tax=Clostridium liquoris TaxID=1289519 RepID=A0A2T0B2X0_9CLOT|nr:M28 family metallopeptidase [Clostridium liquoris]PRR78206.1 Aminopeptidase YwaD precursor [Clostridium liquoris]
MLKKLLNYIITLFLIIFYFSFNLFLSIKPFNSYSVKKNIEYLSSEELKGRLAGTIENIEAANFVKDKFIDNKLKPFNNSYYHSFSTFYPERSEEKPYLRIINNKNEIIKEYVYSKDYKEDMLNFRNNKIIFDKSNNISSDNNFFTVDSDYGKFLFFVPEKDELNFRSSFFPKTKTDMYVMITNSTKKDINNYINNGYKVDCFIPYTIKETTISNVIGLLDGKDTTSSPIIISAHFDHLGTDLKNTVYTGALDNASGISFIIEMSKYLKSIGKPNKNMLFIGFNGEEFGCLGSNEFVKENLPILQNSKVFNFDMIGTDNSTPLCIMGGKNDSINSPLIKSAGSVCSKENIYFNYLFQDSSDHEAFTNSGIEAITFIDNDLTRIHTPNDKASFISTKSIDRCFKVANREIIKYAYNNNPLILNYKEFCITSFIAILLLFILSCKTKRC